jgi:hypothetical protein
MARTGIKFLDEAREELGDPSISAGRSVHERPVTGLRSSKDRLEASSTFLERSGGLKGSLSDTAAPVGVKGLPVAGEEPSQPEKQRGGFISFEAQAKKKAQAPIANFGLPSDRLPTIEELGGALGSIAKFVSQLTKRNRARGLTPGVAVTKTKDRAGVGLTKAKLSTLTKLHETATLSGDKEKAAKIEEQLNAILQGEDAGAFDTDLTDDLAEIAGL